MCGIAGIIDPHKRLAPDAAKTMASSLVHRGPDRDGFYADGALPASFGFRRLAILDLSPSGDQPMHDGPLTMVFNGEIYNHAELRAELTHVGENFKSGSDTEVLLRAFALWGVEKTLDKVNGMYALALLNRDDETLTIARDRFGEKPLYYCELDGALLFASELKALRAAVPLEPCRKARDLYLRYGFIPAPHTIFQNVTALMPGEWITFDVKTLECTNRDFVDHVGEAQENFETALTRAIDLRLRADVPVGVFLSGGVDSSLLLAVAGRRLGKSVPSFTLRMDGDDVYDESEAAAIIAKQCGSAHHIIDINQHVLHDAIPGHIAFMDQPLADAAFIPMVLLSQEARKTVTVALGGEGGDELQAGYTRHKHETPIEILFASKAFLPILRGFLPLSNMFGLPQLRRQLDKAQEMEGHDAYQALLSLWQTVAEELPYKNFREGDVDFYLPNDLLIKLDGATMMHSLEGRCPYLDPDLWATVESMPRSQWAGKKQARALLQKYGVDVPTAKKGLTLPLADWLRGDLKDWAHDHVDGAKSAGLLPCEIVDKAWQNLQSGRSEHAQPLWALAVYGEWCKSHGIPL